MFIINILSAAIVRHKQINEKSLLSNILHPQLLSRSRTQRAEFEDNYSNWKNPNPVCGKLSQKSKFCTRIPKLKHVQQNEPVPQRAACALSLLQGRDRGAGAGSHSMAQAKHACRILPLISPHTLQWDMQSSLYYPKDNKAGKTPSKNCRDQVGPVLSMQEMCLPELSRSQGAKGSPSFALRICGLRRRTKQLFLPDRETTAGQMNTWSKATKGEAQSR